jgi:amino acid transporter
MSTANPTSFGNNWDAFLANNPVAGLNANATYATLYHNAITAGAPTPNGSFTAAVAALPLAALFLFGGNYITGFAGEIKNVKRSIPIALFLSLIFGILYWTITSTLAVNAVGLNWMTAVGWRYDTAGAPGYGLPYAPTLPLMLAVMAYQNPALVYAMFITYIIGSLAPLFAYFWVPTRYFFSWSFDRAIPSKFSDISGRFNTPYIAIAAIVVLGVVLSYVYNVIGWSASFTIGSVIWGLLYVIPGLSLMVFPFVKKDLFAQAPGWVKAKIGGLPVVTVIGLITAVSFAYIGYVAYNNPVVTNPANNGFAIELLGSVIVVGLIVYFASKYYYKSRGINIALAFKDIPPE